MPTPHLNAATIYHFRWSAKLPSVYAVLEFAAANGAAIPLSD